MKKAGHLGAERELLKSTKKKLQCYRVTQTLAFAYAEKGFISNTRMAMEAANG